MGFYVIRKVVHNADKNRCMKITRDLIDWIGK